MPKFWKSYNRLRKPEEEEELEDFDQYTDEDVIDCLYTGLADEMLSNTQGQHALGVSSFLFALLNPMIMA